MVLLDQPMLSMVILVSELVPAAVALSVMAATAAMVAWAAVAAVAQLDMVLVIQ
jgi:hypothetical protein